MLILREYYYIKQGVSGESIAETGRILLATRIHNSTLGPGLAAHSYLRRMFHSQNLCDDRLVTRRPQPRR
jgi:hypothetical protein